MAATDSEFRRPQTAQSAVLAELRRLILTGQLRPGSAIRQDALATSFGVSRVPIREALKTLEGAGQVTYRPHRGYFVAELSYEDVQEIYRIRELLEGEALRVGIPRLTDEDLAVMTECLEKMEEGDDAQPLSEWNSRFHLTMLNASQMPHLLKYIRHLRDATDPYRSLYYMSEEALITVRREHRAILEAARASDVEMVISLTQTHHDHTVEAIREMIAVE